MKEPIRFEYFQPTKEGFRNHLTVANCMAWEVTVTSDPNAIVPFCQAEHSNFYHIHVALVFSELVTAQ